MHPDAEALIGMPPQEPGSEGWRLSRSNRLRTCSVAPNAFDQRCSSQTAFASPS